MESPLDPESAWARRVVGLGGESIKIEVAGIEVDGKIMPWSEMIPGGNFSSIEKEGEFRVPANHFFCIGDNLNNARDSREFGAVPREKIVGKITKIDKGTEPGK
jgi:signal peptidase I